MKTPDPSHLQWVAKADNDFLTIENNVNAAVVPWDAVCFHAQQAAEKFLKAFLAYHGQDPPRTHDLPALLQACRALDNTLPDLRSDAVLLMPYIAASRYPGAVPEPDQVTAARLVAAARRICNTIRERITGRQP